MELNSCFQITCRLDNIATQIAIQCPEMTELTPRMKTIEIVKYLRTNELIGIGSDRNYHAFEHNFLGIALFQDNHDSLPLISTAIFCCIAQRFGLNAQPCGYPFHVHAILRPIAGYDMDGTFTGIGKEGDPMYIDPFHSIEEISAARLKEQLNFLVSSSVTPQMFLGESFTTEIVLRNGRNILNSIATNRNIRHLSYEIAKAKYAALWSSMFFSGSTRVDGLFIAGQNTQDSILRRYLPSLMELFDIYFQLDTDLIEQYILPLLDRRPEHELLLSNLRAMQTNDEMPKQVQRRTYESKNVKLKIGQVFLHRRYGYMGIVAGWDIKCQANEEWIHTMGIDLLQSKRNQSFYYAMLVPY